MNLGQFHSRVSNAIKRGTSLDTVIPFWVADAARLLEQNYTFSWMRRTIEHTFAAGVVPLAWTLDPLVKSVQWVRPVLYSGSDGTKCYGDPLIGVEEDQVTGIDGGMPSGYWVDGQDGGFKLCLDSIPAQPYTIRTSLAVYTDWPILDAATPALLLRGQSALMFQTLILFANEQKDPRMVDNYTSLMGGALNTLLRSEEELKMQHQNDLKMQYSGLS